MTWDNVFLTFDCRVDFILKKLYFDKQVIHDEIKAYKKTREDLNSHTKGILNLNTK